MVLLIRRLEVPGRLKENPPRLRGVGIVPVSVSVSVSLGVPASE